MPVNVSATPRSTAQISWRTAASSASGSPCVLTRMPRSNAPVIGVRDERLGPGGSMMPRFFASAMTPMISNAGFSIAFPSGSFCMPFKMICRPMGFSAGKYLFDERLIDDGDFARRADFGRRQRAAPQHFQSRAS